MSELTPEIEAVRQNELKDLGDFDDAEFAPGSFGFHEAVNSANHVETAVYAHLLAHPSICRDPELFKLVYDINTAVNDLYNKLCDQHFAAVNQT